MAPPRRHSTSEHTPTWNRAELDSLRAMASSLSPGEPGFASYTGDSVCRGAPDLVLRPHGILEVQEVLAVATARNIPVTVAGGLTGMAGGAVTQDGIILSISGLKNELKIQRQDDGTATVRAAAGWVLGDLQREVESEGWMYPPDPTSRNEALLGGTLATNATGEDTLQYGPTRQWVSGVRVVTAEGTVREFLREGIASPEIKAAAGYCLEGEPLDWFIGSEGTLGVITEATLKLVPKPTGVFSGLAFFPEFRMALDFVLAACASRSIRPRALELIDQASLALVQNQSQGIGWPQGTEAAVMFRQEAGDKRDDLLEAWLGVIGRVLGRKKAWSDAVLLFESARDLERLREFRHRVPATLHEKVQNLRDQGGAKVGTDWWVPHRELPKMLASWRPRLEATGLEVMIFGHVGNGHPHVNMLAKSTEETHLARGLVREMCRDAVALGGGVAGEHGLGKLKRELLEIQYPGGVQKMRDLKQRWDPKWILGRGNLFLPEGV